MEVQYRGSVRGALFLSSSLLKPLQRRNTLHISNRDMNPGYVGALHYCKAPLWGKSLDLGYLNLTPRFTHRLLLMLWLGVREGEAVGRSGLKASRLSPSTSALSALAFKTTMGYLRRSQATSGQIDGHACCRIFQGRPSPRGIQRRSGSSNFR